MTAEGGLLGGRYQVGELLGYGGMAEVHRGRDLVLGRDVAIKLLRTDLARDATFLERFRQEARNEAALNHPAIVAVYDTGEEWSSAGEKLSFIVMELIDGWTLKEVLAQELLLQPRRALEIIADICAALEFSHRHGIIHRDIKPGNVMITQNGQVKVMDFGIARALAGGDNLTQASAVIGTAQYLSPEQARGEPLDARSDVYAAGCVLFELLAGRPPFVGDSPVAVAYQHVREDPPAPSAINREVPPEVDAIVLMALAKNPQNRYQSAQEMRADALRAVSGRPVQAATVPSEAETAEITGPIPVVRPMPANLARPPRKNRGISSWWKRRTFPDSLARFADIDATPDLPIVTYVPRAPSPEFGSQTNRQLEELAEELKQQVDDALSRQDWASANSLRSTESAVYTELLRRTRTAPEPGGPRTKVETVPGRIFLSYRRDDSRHAAGRLADRLVDRFGDSRVFMDVDSVGPGMDFIEEVRQAVGSCEVLLAVIGPSWIDAEVDGRRRLDDPEDVVALEIREALNSGVRVIPVLVDGALMPRREQLPADLGALTRRNASKIGHETFRSDVDRLLNDLKRTLSTT